MPQDITETETDAEAFFVIPSVATVEAQLAHMYNKDYDGDHSDVRRFHSGPAALYTGYELTPKAERDETQVELKYGHQFMHHKGIYANLHPYYGQVSVAKGVVEKRIGGADAAALPVSSKRFGQGVLNYYMCFFSKKDNGLTVLTTAGPRLKAGEELDFSCHLSPSEIWDASVVNGRTMLKVTNNIYIAILMRCVLRNQLPDAIATPLRGYRNHPNFNILVNKLLTGQEDSLSEWENRCRKFFQTLFPHCNSVHLGPLHISVGEPGKDNQYVSERFKSSDYQPLASVEKTIGLAGIRSLIDHLCEDNKKYITLTGALSSLGVLSGGYGDKYQTAYYQQYLEALGQELANHWGALGFAGIVNASMGGCMDSVSADTTITEAFAKKWLGLNPGRSHSDVPVISFKDSNTDIQGIGSSGWFNPYGVQYTVEMPYDESGAYSNYVKELMMLRLLEQTDGTMLVVNGGPTTATLLLRLLMAKKKPSIVLAAGANDVVFGTCGFHGFLNHENPEAIIKKLHEIALEPCSSVPHEYVDHVRKVAITILERFLSRDLTAFPSEVDLDMTNVLRFEGEYSVFETFKLENFSGDKEAYGTQLFAIMGSAVAAGIMHAPEECIQVVTRDNVVAGGQPWEAKVVQYFGHDETTQSNINDNARFLVNKISESYALRHNQNAAGSNHHLGQAATGHSAMFPPPGDRHLYKDDDEIYVPTTGSFSLNSFGGGAG